MGIRTQADSSDLCLGPILDVKTDTSKSLDESLGAGRIPRMPLPQNLNRLEVASITVIMNTLYLVNS